MHIEQGKKKKERKREERERKERDGTPKRISKVIPNLFEIIF